MKKTVTLFLILSYFLAFSGNYPDSAFYGQGTRKTHKDMLDTYMAGLIKLTQDNDPAKNDHYVKEKESTITYGHTYWLAAKDDIEKKAREAYLLTLKAPTHLERHQAYGNTPLAPEPLFTQGLFEMWEKLKPSK